MTPIVRYYFNSRYYLRTNTNRESLRDSSYSINSHSATLYQKKNTRNFVSILKVFLKT